MGVAGDGPILQLSWFAQKKLTSWLFLKSSFFFGIVKAISQMIQYKRLILESRDKVIFLY